MAKPEPSPAKAKPVRDNRRKPPREKEWWVEEHKGGERAKPEERQAPVGAAFFRTVEEYDQTQAEKNLTDLNPRLLAEADPEPGAWGYVALLETTSPQREIEKIKHALPLPPAARGVIVDSGLSLRAIVADTQDLGILMEFNFMEEASFDCWIQNEWVGERVFAGKRELLRRAERLLKRYLRRGARSAEESVNAPSPTGALPPGRTDWS